MGTDIHPAIEVHKGGVWRYHRPTTPCKWYAEVWTDPTEVQATNDRMHAYFKEKDGNLRNHKPVKVGDRKHTWDTCKTRIPDFFTWRNYRVFALLANVRNGNGFAGVYTHDAIPFIQDLRGVPWDSDPRTLRKLSNEHSEGWVSLTELKAYDYRLGFREGGVIDEQQFLKFCHDGKVPDGWSGGISGKDIVTLTPEEYANLYESPIDLLQGREALKTRRYDSTKSYHIHHIWDQNLYEEVSDVPEKWIPYLERLVPKGGSDDDVRVVFDFDS